MPEMPSFDETTLAKLAREMAMNIRNVHVIFKEYGITEEQYYELVTRNEFFKRAKEQFTLEWNATTSTEDRVKISSFALIEQLLPRLTKRAMEHEEPLAAATNVGTLLTKTAGIGVDRTDGKNLMERFTITINLGEDNTKTYDKSIEAVPNEIDTSRLVEKPASISK